MTDMGHAREILIKNRGGFIMSYRAKWDGGSSERTGKYPNPQDRLLDLSTVPGLEPGTIVYPEIKIEAGNTRTGARVIYEPQGGLATYKITGTTLNSKVQLESVFQFPRASRVRVSYAGNYKYAHIGEKSTFSIGSRRSTQWSVYQVEYGDYFDLKNLRNPKPVPGELYWPVTYGNRALLGFIDEDTVSGPPFIFDPEGVLVDYEVRGMAASYSIEYA